LAWGARCQRLWRLRARTEVLAGSSSKLRPFQRSNSRWKANSTQLPLQEMREPGPFASRYSPKQHGRQAGPWPSGKAARDATGRATVTDQQASEILWLALNCPWLMQWQIGERYDTTEQVVGLIKRRRRWKHISPIKPADFPWKAESFKRRI
jgi:hypothetical protein